MTKRKQQTDFAMEPDMDRLDSEADELAIGLLNSEATLHLAPGPESARAFAVLDATGIILDLEADPDGATPVAAWGGDTFTGVGEIEALAEMLRAMDATLDERIKRGEDPLLARRDTTHASKVSALWERKRSAIRARAESLLHLLDHPA